VTLTIILIANILYRNKGDRGENIMRNIVGNQGWLGGGYSYYTNNNVQQFNLLSNNAPFPRRHNGFFFFFM